MGFGDDDHKRVFPRMISKRNGRIVDRRESIRPGPESPFKESVIDS